MGQRDKLLDDVANCLDWMSPENFRSFVVAITEDRPLLVARLKKEIARAEKKLLTKT
jgi:hypothetical protein